MRKQLNQGKSHHTIISSLGVTGGRQYQELSAHLKAMEGEN